MQLRLADEQRAVIPIDSQTAASLVVEYHYMHRRPPISFAFGLLVDSEIKGALTFGVPPSRHLQKSACPSDPDLVLELNRLWVDDDQPTNSESWFVARGLKALPARIVVSYADTAAGHIGYIYRALNFDYAGWTDMDRKTPRFDYKPADPMRHTRDAYRNGYETKERRLPKVKYWTVTGNRSQRAKLRLLCGWPSFDWHTKAPPATIR